MSAKSAKPWILGSVEMALPIAERGSAQQPDDEVVTENPVSTDQVLARQPVVRIRNEILTAAMTHSLYTITGRELETQPHLMTDLPIRGGGESTHRQSGESGARTGATA